MKGLKVAILVEDGFEQVELTEPRKAFDRAGTDTRIVSLKGERVRSWNFKETNLNAEDKHGTASNESN